MSFEAALERHLRAITDRDYESFAATVAPREVVLVAADGQVSMTSEHLLALHREWFASPTWRMDARLLHSRQVGDLATCLLELDYGDRDCSGDVRSRSILSLVFERLAEGWRLVQDQNTPITG